MDNKAYDGENGTPMTQKNGKEAMINHGYYPEHELKDHPPPYTNGSKRNGYDNGSIEKKDPEKDDYKKSWSEDDVEFEMEDPWKVTSLKQDYTPWNELSGKQKVLRVVGYILKIILILGCLYMFICSLDFLSSAFKLLGGQAAGRVFQESDILTNPIAGLMMGVLVTVLVQSSSTSTSIVVSMVGAGILEIKTAIPIVMGANIGTSVTNTIVSLGQISDKGEFRRAFAGATVHDMFNWLTVIVFLPIELITGYLYHMTKAIVESLPLKTDKGANKDILKVITNPFTELIIQTNKDAITDIATGSEKDEFGDDHKVLKTCCDKTTIIDCCKDELDGRFDKQMMFYSEANRTQACMMRGVCYEDRDASVTVPSCLTLPWETKNQTLSVPLETIDCTKFNATLTERLCCQNVVTDGNVDIGICSSSNLANCFTSANHTFSSTTCEAAWGNVTKVLGEEFSCQIWSKKVENKTCNKECEYLFLGMHPALGDHAIGAILLVLSLAILCICLICMVKLLHSLLKGPLAIFIKKFINADFPGPCKYFTGYLAILVGAGLTIVVQSSSIFTSTLTPLVGIGVIELDRMYPLTLGSNIGTTTTAILSALASSGRKLQDSLQVAFCHLFFNISGIILFYPLPFMRFPIPLAKFLGNRTANYRWFAIVYILFMFFLLPFIVFVLSIPGWYVLLAVLGPIALILIVIAIIKCIQAKRPQVLPPRLQNWKALPKPMRSLEPYDSCMQKVFPCKRFQHNDLEDNVGKRPVMRTASQTHRTHL